MGIGRLAAALLIVALPAAAWAAPAKEQREPATAPRAAKPAAPKTAAPKTAEPGAGTAARRLEDIHIEGEIPVPQVLFVTGRDQRRFLDFQHRRYLPTSLAIGQETTLPARITWIGWTPVPTRKETTP